MKYRIILKSGATFELDLDSDFANSIKENMMVKNGIGVQDTCYDEYGVYASIVSSEVVVIHRIS